MPWLAVKRNSLFESDNHAMIFNERIRAAHVVLVDELRRAVEDGKEQFPEEYRRSWQLTRMVGVYLVAQMLMAATTAPIAGLLDRPDEALANWASLRPEVDVLVDYAAGTLAARRDEYRRDPSLPDEFNVDFKNTEALTRLHDEARRFFAFQNTATRRRRRTVEDYTDVVSAWLNGV